MNFINPPALWFGLIAIPILILYLLKIRRKQVEISSTLLWRMALRDKQANAPWQKLRRNLLLLLQLISLSVMVLAAARLAFPAPAIAGGSIVLLIDGSASMLATDVSPNRFSAAISTAQGLIRELGTGTTAAAILITHQPSILFAGETDKSRAIENLAGAAAVQGEADWAAAFSLAGGLVLPAGSDELTFVVLSDGGLPAEGLPPLPGNVQYVSIGGSADNLAISALAARPLPSGEAAELFARVSNYGPEERSALLAVSRDGVRLSTEQLRLPGFASVSLVFEDLPPSAATYQATLMNIQASLPLDDFPADDSGYAVLIPPAVRRVLLVSPGNTFIERLLLLLPNLEASKMSAVESEAFQLPAETFDLYIFDGLLPEGELPPGNMLLINPPENDLFDVAGTTAQIENARTTDAPPVQFLEWGPVHVYRSRLVETPAWAEVWVESDSTPLVFAGQQGGRRLAVVAFDLHDSDLPLQVAFPILFANIFEFLAPHGMIENPNGARANESIRIVAPPGTVSISVHPPTGEPILLPDFGPDVLFNQTGAAGLYTAVVSDGAVEQVESFAVNLFSPAESDIEAAPEIRIGQTTIETSRQDAISSREAWAGLLVLALAFLMVEWLAYHRRIGSPAD